MSILSGVTNFFGLDIGTSSIRLVELKGSGPIKSLVKYAYAPLDASISTLDSKSNLLITDTIKKLIAKAQITTTNVAVGLPSQKVFTTVVEVDKLTPKEQAKSIQYQLASFIPTPIDESKTDWSIIGDSPTNPAKVELLISSVLNSVAQDRLDMLGSIGLNVVALEPDNLAITRALLDPKNPNPQMVFDLGSYTSELVISMNNAALLTRSINYGVESLIKSVTQDLNIKRDQAQEVIFKFGLDKARAQGQVYQALMNPIHSVLSEIDLSVKFFTNKYPNLKLNKIIVAGSSAIIPDFPVVLANHTGIDVEIGNAWRNVDFDAKRQNELLAISNYFGVAVGLAERLE
ncbi:MAG TPA: type IV pilus assembly protein PilM [Candidatus Saccharimonadales bacterium]